ncbi:CotH kinase family protein [Fibrobacter sp.]|uniref:CotH kinase family protein n=1 Tax=Fibrobacter sp. TaxID=35828 RepID=UPI00388EFCFD
MRTIKFNLWDVWFSLVLASVVACSDDSSSGTSPEISEPDVIGQEGSQVVIGEDGQPIPGLSSAVVDNPLNSQVERSSSSQKNSGHEGPLPGEDPGMVAVDTTVPFVGDFPVIFSEVSPSNANFKDNDGNDPGWLELYNTSDAPVSLKGVALSNDAKYPRRWIFGDATVPAKGHMIVFLSGKNYADYIPPSDSVNMIGTDCSSEASSGMGMWGGGFDFGGGMGDFGGGFGGGAGAGVGGAAAAGNTGNAENLPGQSSLCFNENGANQIGAVVKVAQGGSYTRVVVNSSAKLGNADQLVIRGFITKSHKIRVNFKEGDNISSWGGKNLRGTGDTSSVYYVRLGDNATDLKRNNVTATTFATETQGSESTTIKITSYIARKRGHEPHTTFKAEDQGGVLYLVSESGVLDSVRYSAVPTGASWSRDAAGKWGFAVPSPYGNTVGEVFAEQAQTNEVNIPASGFYSSPVSVTFPAGTRCEQGGTEPSANSPVVDQTLNISATTVLRCRVFATGSYPSEEVIRTYVFGQAPTVAAMFVTTDPLSMFSPDTGLYMTGNGAAMMDPKKGANFWSNRELPVYVELFEPGSPKTPAFGIMGDYKISGQYSRAKEKKSFSITLREEYGDKRLKYTLFPDHPELKKFKAFSLRNFGNNCGDDYVRDRLGTSMTEGLDVDYQRGRYVVVYYNGKYYGVHDLRERNSEYYYETKYGLDPNDIDLIDAQNEVGAGSATDYKNMLDWLQSNELTSDANYQKIADQIDVDNYMNYMQAEMFLNNGDWPHNNMKKWRVASQKSKWKWFLYDVDFGFGVGYNTQNGNVFSYVTNRNGTNGMGMMPGMGGGQQSGGSISEHTILMIRLLENENFKKAFINRFCVLLSMNFSAERLLKRIDELQSQVQAEVAGDAAFWGYDEASMSSNLEKIKSFAQTRQQTIMSEMQQYFSLGEPAAVTLSAQGSGKILVHNLALDQSSMAVNFYRDVPVTVTAVPNTGAVFGGWSDGVQEATRTFNPGEVTTLTATFK